MNNSKKNTDNAGEMRQDPVTGKWVALAPSRADRPDDFKSDQKEILSTPPRYLDNCSFCNLTKFPQEDPSIRLPDSDHDWQVLIFPNKFPAFMPEQNWRSWNRGPYQAISNTGFHDILIPKRHDHIDGLISEKDFALQLEALVLRYRQLKTMPNINHIQIIKNHGEKAGSSIKHPHLQLLSIPVLPDIFMDILAGSENYAKKHNGKSVYSAIVEYERQDRERIIAENDLFTAFCPYAPKAPFETWIMPRKHNPFFEDMGPVERESLAEIMKKVFSKLYHGLNDPPYNYYIHSAPCDEHGFVCDKSVFSHFRWHMQIIPRLSTWGGFEFATGLQINTVLPEEAAQFLRETDITPPL